MSLIASPLEQFQILNIVTVYECGFDLSITNAVLISLIGLSSFVFCLSFTVSAKTETAFVVPNKLQVLLETIYVMVFDLLADNVGKNSNVFFPFFFCFFNFILILNIIGLVPYSFTVTSHLIVTFALALMVFIGINIICVQKHGLNILTLFLPSGSSLALSFLLIPIEIVSYIFRPISLSVRLFANMMAGHTLLKVIVSFAWTMLITVGGNVLVASSLIPLMILIMLMFLEFAVAIIQAYVFTILMCIYLNDAINLH